MTENGKRCIPIKKLLKGLIGFIVLDLYFVFVPSLLGNPFLQFGGLVLFFPLAFSISKWVGLNGLKGIGFTFHQGWFKNFMISFFIGFGFWIFMYGVQFLSGDLEYQGIRNSSNLLMPILMILVGFFMGSLINGLIIRGYIVNLLKDRLHIGWVFIISILIYAFDDFWYAGFSLNNIIFSILLGLSLTFAFLKTGSIWANTGIHYGLNVAYGLFFGMVASPDTSIIIVKESANQTLLSEILHFLIPAMMFLFVLWVIKFYQNSSRTIKKVPFSA